MKDEYDFTQGERGKYVDKVEKLDKLCGCIKCYEARDTAVGFRYACETCGNKRCPHHSDHELACTNSNKPGQQGSVFQY